MLKRYSMAYYIMISPRKIGRAKIGISNAPKRRSVEVGAAVLWSWRLPFRSWSRMVEAVLHSYFGILNSIERKSDGHTEWFWCANLVAPMLLYGFGFGYWYVAFVPLPLDMLLACVLMWAACWFVPVAAAVMVMYFVQ